MLIAGINTSHHGSICLLEDGNIKFYLEEERLSRKKYDGIISKTIAKLKPYANQLDYVVICNTKYNYQTHVLENQFPKIKIINYGDRHHLCHATHGFYNSNFDSALCFVFDGCGTKTKNTTELESIYYAEFPNKFTPIFKHYHTQDINLKSNDIEFYSSGISVGELFEGTCNVFGFNALDAGKIMGMSSFGKCNTQIPKIFLNNIAKSPFFFEIKNNYFYGISKEDIAYAVQTETETHVFNLIKEYSEKYNCKNIVISGGYALNCVANYKYLDLGINLYVEPIAHDGGTAIGAAKMLWYELTNSSKKFSQENLYYGFEYDLPHESNTNYKEVCSLLKQNPICIFQGKSEAGPRALGNRSILYNPTIPDGKNILNKIKHRENFRPFAAVVLEEYAHEWFDMKGLDSSPFMMYAVNCKEHLREKIPAVLQVNGTSRIQTVNQSQNLHLYNLIKMFYNDTGIPMLLNTSFNLAGEPLVETPDDAIYTMKNSDFEYLYFPETQTLQQYPNAYL